MKKGKAVMIMDATVYMAGLSRSVKIGVFNDDAKLDLLGRYRLKLDAGFAGAVLDRLIRSVREEKCSEGIRVRVGLAPMGSYSILHEYCEIENVEDLCYKMAEMSMMVLGKRRNGDD